MVFMEKEDAIETINNIVAENDISACEIKVCSEAVMDVNLMKATMLGMFQKILDLEENTNEGSSNEAYIWAEEHIPEKIRKDLGIEKPKSYKFVKYRFDVDLVVPENFTEEQINEYARKFLSSHCEEGCIIKTIYLDSLTSIFPESYENSIEDFKDEDFLVKDERRIDYGKKEEVYESHK